MVVRITKTADIHATVLRVDGRLYSRNAARLSEECRAVGGPVILDLSNLRFADATGIAVLCDLAAMGAEIQGASRYIELRLQQGANGCDSGDS